jgi:hypothetical protein
VFESVTDPDLSDHVRFFKALRALLGDRSRSVWIFTTNYEFLIERAASIVRMPLLDGFRGSVLRYFDVENLSSVYGVPDRERFVPHGGPVIRLVKLHGSLDWWKNGEGVYSTLAPGMVKDAERAMILPRRRKLVETLDSPFAELFRTAAQAIGTKCKYLVSCGYGYGDEHINETLLFPRVREGKAKLTALVKHDAQCPAELADCRAFSYGTDSTCYKGGRKEDCATGLWQFEKLVDMLCENAGI